MTIDSLLYRQVHPSWIKHGRVTSQAFKPTRKDQRMLSVYDGDRVSAEGSFRHYTETLRLPSVGVVAVTVGECRQERLPVTPDPTPFPEHVVIDFRSCSNTEIRDKSKYLADVAKRRGWQYGGPESYGDHC